MEGAADPRGVVAGVARFGRMLRTGGLEVGPGRIQDAVSALTVVDIGSRQQVYWALRCTLLSRQRDAAAFDEAFARYFEGQSEELVEQPGAPPPQQPGDSGQSGAEQPATQRIEQTSADDGGAGEEEATESGMQFSAVERLRDLDFARYTDAELRQVRGLMERIARAVPLRRSRRLHNARQGRAFDKRRTLRSAMRTDGYPMVCLWREPRLVPRKLVFVVDVSGSMEPYARAMLIFLQAAVKAGRRVEAFTFGTRLTRVTRELEASQPQRALEAASRAVRDWAGGTRIGTNIRTLNDEWGRLGITRGAAVVIVSDGWERGEIPALEREMARLRRCAHTVVWVNPLAGEPGYEPLAQGMAAALPYVDHFLPGHNLHSLETLAEVLEGLPLTRPFDRGVKR